tara:strand:+ start:199 stop:402 length:204 start_codon:yes stop_codon:yes gene_type:complete
MILYSIIILVFYFATLGKSYAYLDPGSGSVILQGIIAAIALVGSYISFYWKKVIKFFKKYSKKDKKH